jgi:hypothetical protein
MLLLFEKSHDRPTCHRLGLDVAPSVTTLPVSAIFVSTPGLTIGVEDLPTHDSSSLVFRPQWLLIRVYGAVNGATVGSEGPHLLR